MSSVDAAAATREVDALRGALAATLRAERGETGAIVRWQWPDDVDLVAAAAVIQRHRVEPALARSRAELVLPDRLAETIAVAAATVDRVAERRIAELDEVLGLLDRAGLRGLVFKGLPLAVQTTGDHLARGVGDLDLLVEPAAVADAVRALEALGYTAPPSYPRPGTWMWDATIRWYHEITLVRGEASIDLHWHLDPARSQHPPFDALWAQRAVVDVAGLGVPTLGVHEALRHSARHAARDDWRWLRSLLDVVRLSEQEPNGSLPRSERHSIACARAVLDPRLPVLGARLAGSISHSLSDQRHFPLVGVARSIRLQVRGVGRPADAAALLAAQLVKPHTMGHITSSRATDALTWWAGARARHVAFQFARWRGRRAARAALTPSSVVVRTVGPTEAPEFNDVGADIWGLIAEPVSVGEVVAVLVERYGVAPDECETAVVGFLGQLRELELAAVVG